MATQQPLASDLRTIVAVLHVIVDLERMGDHAEGIAKIAIMLAAEPPLKPYVDIPRMAEVAVRMLRASIEAFKQRVLLMPYSMTIPFLLALYNLHLQFARSVDQENLDAYLSQIEALLTQVEDKLENSVQRGATMVTNAYLELREWISQMRGTISTLRGLPAASLAEKQQSLLKD